MTKGKDGIIELLGASRRGAENTCTRMASPGFGIPAGGTIDVSMQFVTHYATFRELGARHAEPGVAVVAIDLAKGQVAAMSWISAAIGTPTVAIIGRHDRADVYLPANETISLRHLAIVVDPVRSFAKGARAVSYRVFDLRTGTAMVDEVGQELRGLRSEGPAFVRCADYLLMFLVTGDPTDWPEVAAYAWMGLPERVYLDERTRFSEGSGHHRAAPPAGAAPGFDPRRTLVTRTRGPVALNQRLVAPGESPIGAVTVRSEAGSAVVEVGSAALHEGILIGRYEDRCPCAGILADRLISRVHLLLAFIDDTLYAIDTCSTSGTAAAAAPDLDISLCRLEEGTTLCLAHTALVEFLWAQ